jgi:hypothetical protein
VWSLFGHVSFNVTTLFCWKFLEKKIFFKTTIMWDIAVERGLMHGRFGC